MAKYSNYIADRLIWLKSITNQFNRILKDYVYDDDDDDDDVSTYIASMLK